MAALPVIDGVLPHRVPLKHSRTCEPRWAAPCLSSNHSR